MAEPYRKQPWEQAEAPPGTPEARELDPVAQAMHELPYGIYIVGSVEDGADGEPRPNGMIADWVMQVSFQPRLVAVGFEQDSRSLARIRANRAFTVNLLEEGQDGLELARRFLQPAEGAKVRGRSEEAAAQHHDKLAGVDYRLAANGCPVLDEALAWLECEATDFLPAGDHTLVLGRVLDGAVTASGEPLTSTYTGWVYSG